MKKAFRLILAAALCGLAFSSCSQDINVDDPVRSSAKGARVINAIFASTTKTVLGEDGLTPYFENGDQIVVYNDKRTEKCAMVVSDGKAWFSTSLEGELTAIYPANSIIWMDDQINGLKSTLEQSGLFKDALWVEATIGAGSQTAVFEHKASLFKVTPPGKTKQLKVTFAVEYVFDEEPELITGVIVVGNGKDALDTYYFNFGDGKLISFSFDTGLETKCIKSGAIKNDEILLGAMYTIDENNWIPNYLPGKFSVADGKQVQFSKGNLQATYGPSGYIWGFAANQYSYIGNAEGNTTIESQTLNAVVDLFGWSTPNTDFGISTSTSSSDYSGDFVDWGKNIGDGSTWHTLTTDEWQYLFKTRTNASSLYKYDVKVCGKTSCLIIAPDGFTGTIETSYDATTWPAAEAAGLVCLPAAGYRDGSNVGYVGDLGYYWSSTALGSDSAFNVGFNSSEVSPGNDDHRDFGFSVRLITESK